VEEGEKVDLSRREFWRVENMGVGHGRRTLSKPSSEGRDFTHATRSGSY
jgi:hypothetical protein